MTRNRLLPVLLALGFGIADNGRGGDSVDFTRDVRPILSSKCFPCHGPDAESRRGRLRLDRADAGPDVRGIAGVTRPGDLEASPLWQRIVSEDPDEVMPPWDARDRQPVTSAERDAIRRWIEDGAGVQDFWAFVPPRLPSPPIVRASWSDHPIDRFVLARLEDEGLEPSPPADRRTLIRRLSLDLTGLPPTVEEVRAFVADRSDRAYDALVDRLLARPQYGEHMARYWLDLVRFADTNGLHHDHYREMTPYRDWVIRAFNDNLAFDRFVIDQLAGDLFDPPTRDQQIASGFHRLHLIIDAGTALPGESFTRNVVDRVTAFGTVFLGLTVQCASCHDHKYDPITQRDFYQLYAFFNNFDGGAETGGRGSQDFLRGLQPPYIELPTAEQAASLTHFDEKIAALDAEIEAAPAPDADGDPDRPSATEERERLRKQRAAVAREVAAALVMKERDDVRPAHVLIRGAYDQPGPPVTRDTPSFLPPLETRGETPTRLDLARWLVDPNHPLTARVAVNRLWQQLFGVGLVRTSEDFGAQGETPSHPALLDYLAVRLVQSGWDVKQLLREVTRSETYRQTSHAGRPRYRADPENRRLARGARFRLDAEVVRDQILAVSGLLNPAMYGRSVKPPQPAGLWETVAMPYSYPRVYEADKGDQVYRRSVYTFWKRALPPPQMTIFDAPTRESCIARRARTNTPLQALVLMNEPQCFAAAGRFARDLLRVGNLTDADRLSLAYEKVTSQLPDRQEREALARALTDFKTMYGADPESAAAIVDRSLDVDPSTHGDPPELAAWTLLAHSLFNLDVAKTRQ